MMLLTKDVIAQMPMEGQFIGPETGDSTRKGKTPVILKLFSGGYTAYITEGTAYLDDGRELSLLEASKVPGVDLETLRGVEDIRFFGYVTWTANELGSISYREVSTVRWPPFGLRIERDRYFEGFLEDVMEKNP